MAVLDQRYRRWTGRPTGYLRRILVIPRYDALEILSRRLWLLAWVACLVPPLILGIVVYVTTNLPTLAALLPAMPMEWKVPPPGGPTYEKFLLLQAFPLTAFCVLVGPPLATRDFANGAIPLYLSKSLRRWDYVLGRCAVLFVLLSLASWIPYLLVFVLECGMAGPAWRSENWGLALDILAGTVPLILILSVGVIAIGALVQRTNLSRAALLFLLLGIRPLVLPLGATLGTPAVQVLSPMDVAGSLRERAFEQPAAEPPAPARGRRPSPSVPPSGLGTGLALLALGAWLGAGLALIARRVRPVEVVK